MRLGLLDMIGLAASLVFALPLANYAVVRLVAGEVALGAGLLVVAVAMVVLPQYFLDPAKIIRTLLAGLLPRQLRGGSGGDAAAADSDPAGARSGEASADGDATRVDEDATRVDEDATRADGDRAPADREAAAEGDGANR